MSDTAFRIIDANVNRAREALRVMEEYARFVLDDACLTEALKQARHELTDAIRSFNKGEGTASDAGSGPESLVRSRDTEGDIGRTITAGSEYDRADPDAVALAAGKRLSEALRVIEEYGKTSDAAFASRIERLRYRGYELERRLALTVSARRRFAQIRLYVIITESLCRGDWLATAEAALRGGAGCLQLREKTFSDRALLQRAKALAALCRRYKALCIVNDRPDVAAAAGADGVHLGRDDLPIEAVRRILPPHMLVGVSTHTVAQVEEAASRAPDYLAVGPMFPTETKPQNHVAGPDTLRAARQRTGLPLVAIGGITSENIGRVLAAAPCIPCVCRAVAGAGDPEDAARRLVTQVEASTSADSGAQP